ncbi:hypothetical protein V6N13_086455 [Hibiscus sabdariffa]|uniref:Bet v I/Major latex protein domain-containing protein n=1 Tax=Hibiscus sabdariffa TaxID=183260 RepID=A0ABR2FT94_9ROSI
MASPALTGKLENDVEIDAFPDKFIYMFTHMPHHVHHTSSERVQGCDLHEGEFGTVGSIICWRYVHDGKAKTAKELVEAIDPEKKSITLRVLEGDVLEEYKSFVVKIQASPKSDGEGSVVHWTLEYERLHEVIGHPETLVPFFAQLTRDIDAHLLKQN